MPPCADVRAEFLDAAADEADAVIAFYSRVDPGLAIQFLDAVESALSRMAAHPGSGTPAASGARRLRLTVFPDSLVYRHLAGLIQEVANAHDRRKPGSWRDRS